MLGTAPRAPIPSSGLTFLGGVYPVNIDAIEEAPFKERWARACLKMPAGRGDPEMEEPKPDLKRKLIMKKLLKGSLVAAFLALGMWASQASAGCNCNEPNGFPMILCYPSNVCNGPCGQDCDQVAMEEQCCFEE